MISGKGYVVTIIRMKCSSRQFFKKIVGFLGKALSFPWLNPVGSKQFSHSIPNSKRSLHKGHPLSGISRQQLKLHERCTVWVGKMKVSIFKLRVHR